MRKDSFKINFLLTAVGILLSIIGFIFKSFGEYAVLFLVVVGFHQLTMSGLLIIYSIIKNKKLLVLYIIYWILVILFFKSLLHDYFYFCLVIALYNLYIHYCSFSNSKYNIIKLWT